MQETIIPDGEGIWEFEYANIPSFNVGDYRTIGNPNKYDEIASFYKIDFGFLDNEYKNEIFIPSGYYRRYVTDIKKRFRPKKDVKIFSWYSYGDYSDNDNFESYYEVWFEDKSLWYCLSQFLLKIMVVQNNLLDKNEI